MGVFILKKNQQMVQGFPVNRSYTKGEADAKFEKVASFVDNEIPSGAINGVNTTFTLAKTPIVSSQHLFFNGQRITNTADYTISGAIITTLFVPVPGDVLLCDYRY